MKRIALISEHASPLAVLGGVDAGGQNVYVKEIARQLTQKGFMVDVFTRRENTSYPRCINWMKGVRVVHVDAGPPVPVNKEALLPYMAAFRDDMIQFIEEEQINYHLVHANFFMSALVAMELKSILKIPYVVTYHALGHIRRLFQGDNDQFPPERLEIERQTMAAADAIIAECPQDREDMIQYYDVSPKKIVVVPCGVNLQEMYPIDKQMARLMLKLPPKEKVILQLGRIVPRKGVDNVIQALAHLNCRKENIRLIIVGGGLEFFQHNHELQRLRLLAKSLGISYAVQFVGHKNREELKYFYSAADLFITTPWYEPFGITPLEAMACGTPVIGANVGGIKYSVVDGQTGKLVPPRDPKALSEAITEMLAQPERLQKMGEKAISRVQKLFTWDRVATNLGKLYDHVIFHHYQEEQKIKRAI